MIIVEGSLVGSPETLYVKRAILAHVYELEEQLKKLATGTVVSGIASAEYGYRYFTNEIGNGDYDTLRTCLNDIKDFVAAITTQDGIELFPVDRFNPDDNDHIYYRVTAQVSKFENLLLWLEAEEIEFDGLQIYVR